MKNDLVKEVRRKSAKIKESTYQLYSYYLDKGVSRDKLAVFIEATQQADFIKDAVRNSNAETYNLELIKIEKEVKTQERYLLLEDYKETQINALNLWNDLNNSGNYSKAALSKLASIYNELGQTVGKDGSKLTIDNLDEMSSKLVKFKKEILKEEKRLKNMDADELGNTIVFNIDEEMDDEAVEVKEHHDAKKYLIGGLAGIALMAFLHSCVPSISKTAATKLNVSGETAAEVENPEEEIDPSVDAEVGVDEIAKEVIPAETAAPINLGEYGTFLDATDNEQVEARAQYIYDNYYAKFLDKLSAEERAFVTVDRIANVIRVMNAQLPLDDNGYKYLDANIVDTYGQAFLDLMDITSSDTMGTLEPVPAYLFTVDGTELQDYIKVYDDLYAKVAEGRNKRDDSIYRPAAEEIARLYWFGWQLQGQNGYKNPRDFDANNRYFAYQATTSRYGSYIKEAEFNQMAAVCINACVDYNTKELENLSIAEIYTAINDGIWNDVIAKSAGLEIPTEPMLVGYWHALNDQLNFEYEHSETKTLN